jgi:hypothetical protein
MSYKHRLIYEKHFGPIPVDEYGRTYDIHHIDGNHSNNEPFNLKAVTIQEHFDIHKSQGDWSACLIMSHRMKLSPSEISELARKNQLRLAEEGKHNFLGGVVQSRSNQRRLKNGTHHLLKREDGSSVSSDCVKKGKHNFLRRSDGTSQSKDTQQQQLRAGTHMNQRPWKCAHCGKSGIGVSNEVQHHRKYCENREL